MRKKLMSLITFVALVINVLAPATTWAASDSNYTFSINPNGGTIFESTSLYIGDAPLYYDKTNYNDISWAKVKRDGFTLDGYYSSANGGVKIYDKNGKCIDASGYWKNKKYQKKENLTVFAQWKNIEYTFSINPNGGIVAGKQSVYVGDAPLMTDKTNYRDISWAKATREGYRLTGYFTAASGGEKVFNADGSCISGSYWKNNRYQKAGNLTVYPQWEKLKTSKAKIAVRKVVVKGKKTVKLKKGKTYKIKATVKPKNATNKKLTYKSSNKKIATVSKNGKIKAKKKGRCTITVTSKDGKKKAKIKVIVK